MNACERCGKAHATIQVTEVARGAVTRLYLCRGCAASQGLLGEPEQEGVDDLISRVSRPSQRERIAITPTGDSCPTCGLLWRDFETRGVLGCEECYKTFAMQLTRMLRETHQAPLPGTPGKRRASDPSALLPELRSLLDQAVREEDYESAAQLRDRIHQLEAAASADDTPEEDVTDETDAIDENDENDGGTDLAEGR